MTDKHRDTNNSCGLTALVVTIISGRGVNEMTPINATYMKEALGTSLEQKLVNHICRPQEKFSN